MTKIKDCPFCKTPIKEDDDNCYEGISLSWIICEGCGAEGPFADSMEEAIALWNAALR